MKFRKTLNFYSCLIKKKWPLITNIYRITTMIPKLIIKNKKVAYDYKHIITSMIQKSKIMYHPLVCFALFKNTQTLFFPHAAWSFHFVAFVRGEHGSVRFGSKLSRTDLNRLFYKKNKIRTELKRIFLDRFSFFGSRPIRPILKFQIFSLLGLMNVIIFFNN